MKGLFLDASGELDDVYHAVVRPSDPPVTLNRQDQVDPADLPALLSGYDFILDDHSFLPTEVMARCTGLRHVIFLGTGARSYMDPEALAALGITVHVIKGYGDIAVAEHAIALMWAAARGLAQMDGGMRAGQWLRTEGMQLTGKTIGLVGFGGIASEVARIAAGSGMRVLAWNRTPRSAPGVTFVPLETLLAGEPRGVVAPVADGRDAGLPRCRAAGADAAGCDPGQHGPRRRCGHSSDGRGPAKRRASPRGARCVR